MPTTALWGVVDGWDVAGAWVAELLHATTMSDSAAAAMSDVRSFMCPFLRAGRRLSARRSGRVMSIGTSRAGRQAPPRSNGWLSAAGWRARLAEKVRATMVRTYG